jgi:putative ubiquitin-RnfH superfamily antitoxin RatB of RatAB toxin-antitoxin module
MKVEVYWCASSGSLESLGLEVVAEPGQLPKVAHALALLPDFLQERIERTELQVACFGQARHLDSPLQEGDRLELLGPVLLDVRAERAARVKAARSRERGPYNRSFSGVPTHGKR